MIGEGLGNDMLESHTGLDGNLDDCRDLGNDMFESHTGLDGKLEVCGGLENDMLGSHNGLGVCELSWEHGVGAGGTNVLPTYLPT